MWERERERKEGAKEKERKRERKRKGESVWERDRWEVTEGLLKDLA